MDPIKTGIRQLAESIFSSPSERARSALAVMGVGMTFLAEFLFGLGGAAIALIGVGVLVGIWPRWLAEQRWDKNLWSLLVLAFGVSLVIGFGLAYKLLPEQSGQDDAPVEAVSGSPDEPGNRVVQIVNGKFQAGGHSLSVEFGVNRITIPPGYGVGVSFAGQRYTEVECVFNQPNIHWGWDSSSTPCEAVFEKRGDMDRFEIRPMNWSISPRSSLYLWFRAEQELELTDCYFQASYNAERTPCDSPRIEFRETSFPRS